MLLSHFVRMISVRDVVCIDLMTILVSRVEMCVVIDIVVCCFFQAEDGIRDLVRSRGLGDV